MCLYYNFLICRLDRRLSLDLKREKRKQEFAGQDEHLQQPQHLYPTIMVTESFGKKPKTVKVTGMVLLLNFIYFT